MDKIDTTSCISVIRGERLIKNELFKIISVTPNPLLKHSLLPIKHHVYTTKTKNRTSFLAIRDQKYILFTTDHSEIICINLLLSPNIFVYNANNDTNIGRVVYLYIYFKQEDMGNSRKAKGRTGWPQHVWALELKQEQAL